MRHIIYLFLILFAVKALASMIETEDQKPETKQLSKCRYKVFHKDFTIKLIQNHQILGELWTVREIKYNDYYRKINRMNEPATNQCISENGFSKKKERPLILVRSFLDPIHCTWDSLKFFVVAFIIYAILRWILLGNEYPSITSSVPIAFLIASIYPAVNGNLYTLFDGTTREMLWQGSGTLDHASSDLRVVTLDRGLQGQDTYTLNDID